MAILDMPPTPEAGGADHLGPPLVLVADDDELIRRLSRSALEHAGFRVIEAADGAEAVRLLREQPVSLALLDVQMPALSGRQVVQQLRADPATATLPVVLVTADDSVDDRVAGLTAGADDYLTKPYAIEELVARVRAHLRAQNAWRDTLAAHVRQRSALARSLAVAGRQPSLAGAGAVLCHALVGQAGVRGAAILRFTTNGTAVPVATSGDRFWGLGASDQAPPPISDYLVSRAGGGPWMELPANAVGRPVGLGASSPVACAPLVDDGGALHGLLALQLSERTDGALDTSAALSAALDFAAVVHGLLRRGLLAELRADADGLELSAVLRSGAFRPHFQPIVVLDTAEVVGAEALTRFADGANPETRFREAAARGFGTELELATLRAALDEAAALTPTGAWISLNVSPALMMGEREALDEAVAATEREVVLELSEQEAVADYDAMRRALAVVGGGLRLSIDDAGSGFASLRHILRLEPDFVKLDRSWVHGVESDPARQALIAGLRHFADQTGAALVAEGIEQEAEREVLVDLRVDLGQGYLFGRPVAVGA